MTPLYVLSALAMFGFAWWRLKQPDGATVTVTQGDGEVDANLNNNPVSTKLTASEIASYARAAGFTDQDLTAAVAIALAESGGNVHAYNPETAAHTPPGMGSYGLWQIYSRFHRNLYDVNPTELYDPAKNAAAAYQVYVDAGYSFTPWSTYQSGAYEAHLDIATQAVNA